MADFADWTEDEAWTPDIHEVTDAIAAGEVFGLRSTDRQSILVQIGDSEREVTSVPLEVGVADGTVGIGVVFSALAHSIVQACLSKLAGDG